MWKGHSWHWESHCELEDHPVYSWLGVCNTQIFLLWEMTIQVKRCKNILCKSAMIWVRGKLRRNWHFFRKPTNSFHFTFHSCVIRCGRTLSIALLCFRDLRPIYHRPFLRKRSQPQRKIILRKVFGYTDYWWNGLGCQIWSVPHFSSPFRCVRTSPSCCSKNEERGTPARVWLLLAFPHVASQ